MTEEDVSKAVNELCWLVDETIRMFEKNRDTFEKLGEMEPPTEEEVEEIHNRIHEYIDGKDLPKGMRDSMHLSIMASSGRIWRGKEEPKEENETLGEAEGS